MDLISPTTYFPYTGELISRSIITEKHCDITDVRYSAEAHIYCSAQPSVFFHIVLNDDVNTFLSFSSSTKKLLCELVVSAYCLL